MDWSSLHSDLLVLILGFISASSRLRLAALVCRHWNLAARKSVTALPINAVHLLPHLPSVTRLYRPKALAAAFFTPDLLPLELPSSITELDYKSVHREPCCCTSLRALTALKRLRLATNGCCPEPYHVIARNTLLTDLKHTLERGDELGQLDLFTSLRLLQLRRASIAPTYFHSSMFDFLAAHASQLHTLTLGDFESFEYLPNRLPEGAGLSALTSLKVGRSSTLSEKRLKVVPSLTSLSFVTHIYDDEEAVTAAFPCALITALNVINFSLDADTTPRLISLLRRCTNLRKLTLHSSPGTLPASVVSGLHKLHLYDTLDLTEAVNLRSLCCSEPPTLLPAAMPHLRHFEVHCTTAEAAREVISRILSVAPRLSSLTLGVRKATEAPLVALLQEADAAGVYIVTLVGPSPFPAALRQRLQALVLHCEVSFPSTRK